MDDRLQEYYRLLRNAFSASEAVDNFDLRSENFESRRQWRSLVIESSRAQMELVVFIKDHQAEISFQLGSAMTDDTNFEG